MSSAEYASIIAAESRTFIRCDHVGTPDQRGAYWKIRDDIYAAMLKSGECEPPPEGEA